MDVIIRNAHINDAIGKGYVHYTSWHETYRGIINDKYLETVTLEKCIDLAKNHPENTIIAIVDNKIVGFAYYVPARDEDLSNAGEVMAIYLLKEYQGLGIGKMLMNTCLEKLSKNKYDKFLVWVLKDNKKAINFYSKCGFEACGVEKEIVLGEPIVEIRMIKRK